MDLTQFQKTSVAPKRQNKDNGYIGLFVGVDRADELREFCKERNLVMARIIRALIDEFLKEHRDTGK